MTSAPVTRAPAAAKFEQVVKVVDVSAGARSCAGGHARWHFMPREDAGGARFVASLSSVSTAFRSTIAQTRADRLASPLRSHPAPQDRIVKTR